MTVDNEEYYDVIRGLLHHAKDEIESIADPGCNLTSDILSHLEQDAYHCSTMVGYIENDDFESAENYRDGDR